MSPEFGGIYCFELGYPEFFQMDTLVARPVVPDGDTA